MKNYYNTLAFQYENTARVRIQNSNLKIQINITSRMLKKSL